MSSTSPFTSSSPVARPNTYTRSIGCVNYSHSLSVLPTCPSEPDLSITEVAGKSPLPTIIVTPCSPSSTHEFSLAFIPSPPKQGFRERLHSYKPPYAPSSRTRSIICGFLFLFFICHLLAHRLTVRYPLLDYVAVEADASGGDVPPHQSFFDWFDSWSDAGRDDPVMEHVPEAVSFNHEVGSWLD